MSDAFDEACDAFQSLAMQMELDAARDAALAMCRHAAALGACCDVSDDVAVLAIEGATTNVADATLVVLECSEELLEHPDDEAVIEAFTAAFQSLQAALATTRELFAAHCAPQQTTSTTTTTTTTRSRSDDKQFAPTQADLAKVHLRRRDTGNVVGEARSDGNSFLRELELAVSGGGMKVFL